MSKIVVLGADGFIGKHLVSRLASNKNNEIVAFDRFSTYQTGLGHPYEKLSTVQIMPGNFNNRDELARAIDGADYVFHLISSTNPATSTNDPFIDIDTNVRNSIELLEICSEKNVGKIIFFSSGGTVYGDIDDNKIAEDKVPAPRSPYAIGKLTIEHFLRYFKFVSSLDYVVYRVSNPYGPGQNIVGKQGVIPIFMHKFLIDEPLTIFGDGTMVRDYIYINDLIDMVVGSYDKPNKYNEYNVGSGKGVTVNELVLALEKCTGRQAKIKRLAVPATYIHKSVLDITRFENEFKISPSTSLNEGVRQTWEYVKELS